MASTTNTTTTTTSTTPPPDDYEDDYTTEEATTTEEDTQRDTEMDACLVGKREGFYYPVDTSHVMYIECLNKQYTQQHCPPGQMWHRDRKICDWPYATRSEWDQRVGLRDRPCLPRDHLETTSVNVMWSPRDSKFQLVPTRHDSDSLWTTGDFTACVDLNPALDHTVEPIELNTFFRAGTTAENDQNLEKLYTLFGKRSIQVALSLRSEVGMSYRSNFFFQDVSKVIRTDSYFEELFNPRWAKYFNDTLQITELYRPPHLRGTYWFIADGIRHMFVDTTDQRAYNILASFDSHRPTILYVGYNRNVLRAMCHLMTHQYIVLIVSSSSLGPTQPYDDIFTLLDCPNHRDIPIFHTPTLPYAAHYRLRRVLPRFGYGYLIEVQHSDLDGKVTKRVSLFRNYELSTTSKPSTVLTLDSDPNFFSDATSMQLSRLGLYRSTAIVHKKTWQNKLGTFQNVCPQWLQVNPYSRIIPTGQFDQIVEQNVDMWHTFFFNAIPVVRQNEPLDFPVTRKPSHLLVLDWQSRQTLIYGWEDIERVFCELPDQYSFQTTAHLLDYRRDRLEMYTRHVLHERYVAARLTNFTAIRNNHLQPNLFCLIKVCV